MAAPVHSVVYYLPQQGRIIGFPLLPSFPFFPPYFLLCLPPHHHPLFLHHARHHSSIARPKQSGNWVLFRNSSFQACLLCLCSSIKQCTFVYQMQSGIRCTLAVFFSQKNKKHHSVSRKDSAFLEKPLVNILRRVYTVQNEQNIWFSSKRWSFFCHSSPVWQWVWIGAIVEWKTAVDWMCLDLKAHFEWQRKKKRDVGGLGLGLDLEGSSESEWKWERDHKVICSRSKKGEKGLNGVHSKNTDRARHKVRPVLKRILTGLVNK